jgi:AraC-like DNA-binding protein
MSNRQYMKRKPGKIGRKGKSSGVAVGKKASGRERLHEVTKHVGINKCLGFTTENFRRPIQVKDMVKISGMSRRGFIKAFDKHIGANPGAVLRHLRLEYAKRLLTEQDLKLKEIACQCGYRNENSFCVAFQRTMGMAPKQFQRQYWLAACQRQLRGGIEQPVSNALVPPMLTEMASASFNPPKQNFISRVSRPRRRAEPRS